MSHLYQIQRLASERASRILPISAELSMRPEFNEIGAAGFTQLLGLIKGIYADITEMPWKWGFPLNATMPMKDFQREFTDSHASPLKPWLKKLDSDGFSHLKNAVMDIYSDIMESPAKWGLSLEINFPDGDLKFDEKAAENSLNSPFVILYLLTCVGNFENEALLVDIQAFEKEAEKMKLAAAIRKHEVYSLLAKQGFDFGGYRGEKFSWIRYHRSRGMMTVTYPSNPTILKTIKAYADCCLGEDVNIGFKKFVLFDYRLVSVENDKLPTNESWKLLEEAQSFALAFSEQLLECGLHYRDYSFEKGAFYRGRYKVAEISFVACGVGFILPHGDDPWLIKHDIEHCKNTSYFLRLHLSTKGRQNRFAGLPAHIFDWIKDNECTDCDLFAKHKARYGKCNKHIDWEHEGEKRKICGHRGLEFECPRVEDVGFYCGLV